MKAAGILLAAALGCAAQIVPPPAPPIQTPAPAAVPAPAPPQFDRVATGSLESQFETRVSRLDVNDPIQLMGACTGVYVNGYGMVFTLPVVLANPPTISPFHMTITKDEKTGVHKRKVTHLPVLRKALQEMLVSAFSGLPKLLPTDKIALGVRLFYLDWEDRSGLPSLIVLSADRASALAGNIQVDEQ
jgi:hypothetical protein